MYINKSFSNGYTIPKREYLNTLLISAWKALCHTATNYASPDTLHITPSPIPPTAAFLLIPYTWEALLLPIPYAWKPCFSRYLTYESPASPAAAKQAGQTAAAL